MKNSFFAVIVLAFLFCNNLFSQSLFITASGVYSNSVHSSFLKANANGYGAHFRADYVPNTSRMGLFTMYGLRSYHFTTESEGTAVNEQKNNLVMLSLSQSLNRGGFVVLADFGLGAAFSEKITSSASEKRTDFAMNIGITGIAELGNSVGLHTSVGYIRYFDNKLNSGYVLGSVGLLVKIF